MLLPGDPSRHQRGLLFEDRILVFLVPTPLGIGDGALLRIPANDPLGCSGRRENGDFRTRGYCLNSS